MYERLKINTSSSKINIMFEFMWDSYDNEMITAIQYFLMAYLCHGYSNIIRNVNCSNKLLLSNVIGPMWSCHFSVYWCCLSLIFLNHRNTSLIPLLSIVFVDRVFGPFNQIVVNYDNVVKLNEVASGVKYFHFELWTGLDNWCLKRLWWTMIL